MENNEFRVGDGATMCMWSDRRAGTIIEARGRIVVWQEDKATRTDNNGMSENQHYEYERDSQGMTRTFTLRKNGRWVQKDQDMRSGTRLVHGRHQFYDYSF